MCNSLPFYSASSFVYLPTQNRKRMIGIFDSGVGGLSVWRELLKLIPNAEYLYIADSGNCPYGPKPKEEVIERCKAICNYLIDQKADIIVIACNTATAGAVSTLRTLYTLPIVGMEPAVKPAALGTKTGVIGVLATKGTFKGNLYRDTRNRYAYNKKVIEQVGDGLVELVESGKTDTDEAIALLAKYINPMLRQNADQLVLGCTHYPFLIEPIKRIVGKRMKIVNPAPAVAMRTMNLLKNMNLLPDNNSVGNTIFCSTGDNLELIKKMSDSIIISLHSSPKGYEAIYKNLQI